MRHFLRLFWCSQNRKSVIFELAPGPRSALGAPGRGTAQAKSKTSKVLQKLDSSTGLYSSFF